MTRFLIPLALALTVAACDTGGPDLVDLRVDALSHDAAALVGTWDLATTTSSGQWGPPVTTPYQGARRGYTFRADGTVEVQDPDGTVRTEAYAVVAAGPSYPDAPPSLRIGSRREYWGIDGDRLYFDNRPLDGDLYEYRRR